MLLSNFHIPTLKDISKDVVVKSHQLMLKAGIIRQNGSGLYSILPLGNIILRKISDIIREELKKINACEVILPTIQSAKLWQESGRYDDYGLEMLRIKDRHAVDLLYSPTAEEAFVDLFRSDVKSYKNLPMNLYQINWKFRDEIRPRFGLMRCREFLMMDAYSFDLNEENARQTYYKYYAAYLEIFKKIGVFAIPMKADNGAIGGDLSHEFQIIAENGESAVFYDQKLEEISQSNSYNIEEVLKLYANTEEKHDTTNCPVAKENLMQKRGIEVGHIFYFGDKYTKAMGVEVNGQNGENITPVMGSYGIGVTRLMAAVIEASHDEKGIIWPKNISPFQVILINVDVKDEEVCKKCDDIYSDLKGRGIEVLYDNLDGSFGQKLANADLIGIPLQIIIGKRGLKDGKAQLVKRKNGEKSDVGFDELMGFAVGGV